MPNIPPRTGQLARTRGYAIPDDATLAPSQWTIHRSERFWDDPLTFHPERFAGESDRHLFAYFPFGGGPRRCIGQQFAMVEGKLILATLVNQFHLELRSEPGIDLSVSITTRPIEPIEMEVKPRETVSPG